MLAAEPSNGQPGPPALGFQFTAEYFARPEDFEPPTEQYCEDDDMMAYLGMAEPTHTAPAPASRQPQGTRGPPQPAPSSYVAAPATLAAVQHPPDTAPAPPSTWPSHPGGPAVEDLPPAGEDYAAVCHSPPAPSADVVPSAAPYFVPPANPPLVSKAPAPEATTASPSDALLDEGRLGLLLEATRSPDAPVARQCFHALDPLGRGRVSVVVWAKGLTRLGLPMDMGSTMEIIVQAHPDPSGCVDFEGFRRLLRAPLQLGLPIPPARTTPGFVQQRPLHPSAGPSAALLGPPTPPLPPQPRPVSPPVTALHPSASAAVQPPSVVVVPQGLPASIPVPPSPGWQPPAEVSETHWQEIPGTGCQCRGVSSWPMGQDFVAGGIPAAVAKLQGPGANRSNWTLHPGSGRPVLVRQSSAQQVPVCKHCRKGLTFGLTLPSSYPGQLYGCDRCAAQRPASAGVWHCGHCHDFDLCLGCLPPPDSALPA
eukprot:EG_transcript_9940